uniref:Cell division protein FtsZ n=1 Tax=candidate division WOR-3 bacterium TaxID=2052148 RepID=A0A7V4E5U4_UNCW3
MITAYKRNDSINFKIKVMGIGGAGGNIVHKIFLNGLKCETIILNTDSQAISKQRASHLITIGKSTTKGGGAGADPDLGKKAAEESIHEILLRIQDTDLLILVAGLGNGTGSGASPVVAKYAKEKNILTVGVFTLPFEAEGRKDIALRAINEMEKYLNTMVIIDNNMISELASLDSSVGEAFAIVDNVVKNCVESIINIVQETSYVNLDFNDLKVLISRGGLGYFAKGVAEKPEDLDKAIESVVFNPLLTGVTINDVKGALLYIKSNGKLKMAHFDQILDRIRDHIPKNAPIKYGLQKEGDGKTGSYAEIYLIGATGKKTSENVLDKIANKRLNSRNFEIPPGVRKNKK